MTFIRGAREKKWVRLGHLLACLSFAGLLVVGIGCRSPSTSVSSERFQFVEPHMGTLFTITLYAAGKEQAEEGAKAAFARVKDLDEKMTDYNPESELMQLCKKETGQPHRVSDDLFDVLQKSQRFAELTEGGFDITVGPLVQLWRRARRQHELPEPERITEARKAVGYQKLRLDARAKTVTLLVQNVRLDLGGIGKGYAADQALAVLRQHGIRQAIVAASGDIAIGDSPPGKPGWTIGVGAIDAKDATLARTLVLHNAGVSTAGDTEQYVELNGVRYSHVVDPKTGVGLTNRIWVTLVAKDATTTDGLDTGLAVMGLERALGVIERVPGVAGLIVTMEGEKKITTESKRFKVLPRAGR